MPDAVLQKAAWLTSEVWTFMRTHPIVGADVASRVPALRALAPTIQKSPSRTSKCVALPQLRPPCMTQCATHRSMRSRGTEG